jgi:transcriptional regulator with XRE-family HTH domain
MSLGDRIRTRLTQIGMTQAELCKRAEVPQSTLNSILQRGSRSTPHLVRIATALRTSPAWLTEETDDPDSPVPDLAMSFEERELLGLTRRLERADFEAVSYLVRRLVGAGVAPAQFADDRAATIHDRKLGYRSG